MDNEIGAEAHTPLPPKRRYGQRVLLSMVILFVLIGATVFLLVHSFNQNIVSSAKPVPDLPTTIRWQRIQPDILLPTLIAAPNNPAILYMYSRFGLTSGTGSSLARSIDAGVHWQTFANTFPSGDTRDIVVNPTNANDLYVSLSHIGVNYEDGKINPTYMLKQSSDGGRTWTNIAATLLLPSGQSTVWEGGDLTFVGQRLFATQDVHGVYYLISSVDGGRTWIVVDAQLSRPHQELLSYVVDPSQTSTIYELVGPIVHVEFRVVSGSSTPPPMPTPALLPPGQLYKTTDGGSAWQELLASVPYGSKIQLATSNPHLLYIGGLIDSNNSHIFHMQTSQDGGATWQMIARPAFASLLGHGLVDGNGLFYDAVRNASIPRTGDQALTPVALLSSMQRYNPSTREWSTLNIPTGVDYLLAITPDISHNGDIIWMTNIDETLFYRGTL